MTMYETHRRADLLYEDWGDVGTMKAVSPGGRRWLEERDVVPLQLGDRGWAVYTTGTVQMVVEDALGDGLVVGCRTESLFNPE